MQLSVTVTTGVAGIAFGEAFAKAGALVHPFTVLVTEYDPPLLTVIDGVVSPVLHSKSPCVFTLRTE